jgi:pimeloyl-ACP methyl ester carboxylesterase
MKTLVCLSVMITLAIFESSECKQHITTKEISHVLVNDSISQPKINYTYNTPKDTTKNYYVTIFPEGKIKGTLILIPGFGELPTSTLIETDIYKYASKSGYITFIPALGDWSFLYIDDASHQKLNEFIDNVFSKYSLQTNHFIIGGHSFGGVAAFQYTERAYQPNSKLRRPSCVFGIDPPLDIERMYISMTTTDRPPKHPISQSEDAFIADLLQKTFKTNPKENPKYFWQVSPFSRSDTSHVAIKSIKNVPLRIYNDPDINWYIDNRHVDYTDMNVFDAASMINWLKSMGNDKAELINCLGKGFRKEKNYRHPHSWSIVDGKELIDWMDKF